MEWTATNWGVGWLRQPVWTPQPTPLPKEKESETKDSKRDGEKMRIMP